MTASNPTDSGKPGPQKRSGYATTDCYVAQEIHQGGRIHYLVALPLERIPATLGTPDPKQPFEDNRIVRLGHAEAFAEYVRKNENWHSGPLTVRIVSEAVTFKPHSGGESEAHFRFGDLEIQRNARASIRIVDGQHRALGVDILFKRLGEDLNKASSRLANAERNGEPEQALKSLRATRDEILQLQTRLATESIMVDLLIENDADEARQIFVDVANNAWGISKTVTTRFDQRKVVSRAANLLLGDPNANPIIRHRVDLQLDRITGKNPNVLGASHLSDIIRILAVGNSARVTKRMESDLKEAQLAAEGNAFFDLLVGSFDDLNAIADGSKEPAELRGTSLVLSTTMLRVLAGVHFELRKNNGVTAISSFFARLAPHMTAPIDENTPTGKMWIDATDSLAFTSGATAPGARAQQVKELVAVISGWMANPPPTLIP